MLRTKALRDVLEWACHGTDRYFRYTGRLCVRDGAREAPGAAECYWIFDLLASEVVPLLTAKANDGTFSTSIVTVRVRDGRATLEATNSATTRRRCGPNTFRGRIFPQGQRTLFELGLLEFDTSDCQSIVAILLSEHSTRGRPWTAKSVERLAWGIKHDADALLAELRAEFRAQGVRLATSAAAPSRMCAAVEKAAICPELCPWVCMSDALFTSLRAGPTGNGSELAPVGHDLHVQ